MLKNTLGDLNNHLFAELERLSDEEIKGEELEQEIKRAEAISNVSTQVIQNGTLVLKAAKYKQEAMDAGMGLPKFMGGDKD